MQLKELTYFKELLLSQRSDILNKHDGYGAGRRGLRPIEAAGKGDEGDLAVSEVTLSVSLRLEERHGQMLQKIDRALSKIEVGSYGLCEQCQEDLNPNRLKARPVAALCIACKEEQEKRATAFA